MNKIVEEAIRKIKELEENTPCGKHIITGDVRKLSSKLFSQIEDKSIENVFILCEELLNEHLWALGVIAFDFAYRMKNHYNESTYDIFYHWLKGYVRGWGDCDDFCTHAFGELLRQKKSLFVKIIAWTDDNDFWVRRVAIEHQLLRKDKMNIELLEKILENNLNSSEFFINKAIGWALRDYSKTNPEWVREFIENYVSDMAPLSIREGSKYLPS